MESKRGLIFDIQRYSLHDGPGLRTNVFFKGCSLNCQWCSNPESQINFPEVAFFEKKCFLCGKCIPICAAEAIHLKNKKVIWDRSKCDQCFDCVNICPSHAFTVIGKEITAVDVMKEIIRDLPFYGENGGITLTGGEPALQVEFVEELLKLAKSEGLHTAIETCGAVPWKNIKRLLPYLDLVLFDLKHMDSEIHQQFTGEGNIEILSNLTRIVETEVELVIRVPLIPTFNADKASLTEIAEFIKTLNHVNEVHVLGYHTLGRAKYHALGINYKFIDQSIMQPEEIEKWAEIFREHGFIVLVGG